MQVVGVELYPAAYEDSSSDSADADASHCVELPEGDGKADDDERAVEAVFDDAELRLRHERDDEHDALACSDEDFRTDAEKDAEGEDDSAQDAVEPLPVDARRCDPV